MGRGPICGQCAIAADPCCVQYSHPRRHSEKRQHRTHGCFDFQLRRGAVKPTLPLLFASLILAIMPAAHAQDETLNVPKSIEAGSAFSIQNAGSGEAALYIVGPGQVLKRTVQLGTSTYFPAGSICNAR